MIEYFWFKTRAGIFLIKADGDCWTPWFEEERLMGRYSTPQRALDDLAGGTTDWPSCGDPSEMGLPDEIDRWQVKRRVR